MHEELAFPIAREKNEPLLGQKAILNDTLQEKKRERGIHYAENMIMCGVVQSQKGGATNIRHIFLSVRRNSHCSIFLCLHSSANILG